MRKCDTNASLGFMSVSSALFEFKNCIRVYRRRRSSRRMFRCIRAVQCMRERDPGKERKRKKRVTPVRWSGLISEISSAKKFRRVHSSSSSLPPLQMHMNAPVFLCLPPSRLSNPFSLHRPRGNLRALLTSAIIVLAAASHFYFYLYLRDTARAFNNRREKV